MGDGDSSSVWLLHWGVHVSDANHDGALHGAAAVRGCVGRGGHDERRVGGCLRTIHR